MSAAQTQTGGAFAGSPYLHELALRTAAPAPQPIPLATLEAYATNALGPAAQMDAGKAVLSALSYYAKLPEIYGAHFPAETINPKPSQGKPDLSAKFVDALPDQPVLLAVLDEGLPFLHQRTIGPKGASRMVSAWQQEAKPQNLSACRPPIGRCIDNAEIQRLIDGGQHEDTAYRSCAAIDYNLPTSQRLSQPETHGAAVLGLAAGKKDDTHLLMGVSFPPAAVKDSSGTMLPFFVLLAICHCVEQTQRLAEYLRGSDPKRFKDIAIPLVINLSYGILAGPKDGSGTLESVMEHLSHLSPNDIPGIAEVQFVLPMGNGRQSQTAAHLDGAETNAVTLRLIPDDKTPSFVELWRAADPDGGSAAGAFLTVVPPGTTTPVTIPSIPYDQYQTVTFGCGTKVRVYSEQRKQDGIKRDLLLLAFPPTLGPTPSSLARSGDWQLQCAPGGTRPVDVFVQRDEGLFGLDSGGRQSRLVDTFYRRFDSTGNWIMEDTTLSANCPVKRTGTVSAFANAASVTRVGGIVERTGKVAPYSARAFPQQGRPQDGDWLRPSDASPNQPGIPVDGTLSGTKSRLSGTSVASPQMAVELCRTLGGTMLVASTAGVPPNQT